ncbi:MAG: cupin domain-containing protein [Chloroflexota bacterium]
MAKLFTKAELPHFHSTRDTRDRLDLITENVPVEAPGLRADRILYHPGDTCAKHYHKGCHHVFVILEGEGMYYNFEEAVPLSPGMTLIVPPEEPHWFENNTTGNLKFVEFWAPRPTETVWIIDDDT